MLCELAERGRGVALLPRSLATAWGQDVRVFALREPPTRRLGIAWREGAPRARHLRPHFVAAATGALADETQKQSPLADADSNI